MKKFFTLLLTFICVFSFMTFSACSVNNEKPNDSVTIVTPDGAPALSIAKLIKDNEQFGEKVNYRVVVSENIKNFVVGSGEKADIAIIPVNMASLLLGSGNEYKGVASVTHGNLYILSKNETTVNAENAAGILKGKTVAVVNLANVPGLTTKAALKKLNVSFTEDESKKSAENVYIIGINGTDVATKLTTGAADYVIAPEPAVSTITNKVPAIKKVGSLNDLYGNYPQAIMVAKSSLLEKNHELIKKIFDAMVENAEWITKNPTDAASAVASKLTQGLTPSFSPENTTESSVEGSKIMPVKMTDATISEIKEYITAIKQFGGETPVAKDFSENFFMEL